MRRHHGLRESPGERLSPSIRGAWGRLRTRTTKAQVVQPSESKHRHEDAERGQMSDAFPIFLLERYRSTGREHSREDESEDGAAAARCRMVRRVGDPLTA